MLPDALERFGIRTLGELAKLPRAALADRFGPAGPLARDLAQGKDTPLVPRTAAERLEERLELPESASGVQLQRGLELLIDRLLARRERRGRALRAVVLSAKLVEGGTWRARVTFREPLADPRRMRLVLGQKLAELPSPTDVLRLRAEGFGPPAGDQRSLLAEPAAIRRARLREAVRQARSVAGPGRGAAHHPRRSRLAGARAAPDARAMGSVRRLATPARGPASARGRAGARRRSAAARSRRCASPGWSRTAGGRDAPLRRRYWEVVTADGRDLVVYRDLEAGAGSRSAECRSAWITDQRPVRTAYGAVAIADGRFSAHSDCHSTIAAYARHGRQRSGVGAGRRAPEPQVARRPRVGIAQRAHRDVLDRPRAEAGQREQRRARGGDVERRVEPQAAGDRRGQRAQRRARARRACPAARPSRPPRAPGSGRRRRARDQLLRRPRAPATLTCWPSTARTASSQPLHAPGTRIPGARANSGSSPAARRGRGRCRTRARRPPASAVPRTSIPPSARATSIAVAPVDAVLDAPRGPGSRACRASRAPAPSRTARGRAGSRRS